MRACFYFFCCITLIEMPPPPPAHTYVSGVAERTEGAVRRLIMNRICHNREREFPIFDSDQTENGFNFQSRHLMHSQPLKEELC